MDINMVYIIMAIVSFWAVVPMLYFDMSSRIIISEDEK